MCDNVIFHNLDFRCAMNQGQLAAIIGHEHFVMETGAIFHESDCLCPVNLAATAIEAGYDHSRKDANGDHDAFDYHWRKESV